MKRKLHLSFILATACLGATASPVQVSVDASKTLAHVNRADLLGINIAVYNDPKDFATAMQGLLSDLQIGLLRMPGGSVSDKYYWNGNGVMKNGQVDPSKFEAPYWQVDYSDYKPGFIVDNRDRSLAERGYIQIDTKEMHEITLLHPTARNLVTVNAGTGSPEMAAEWVRWANIENKWGVKYWEIGNELNGEWEAGHIRPDGTTMTAETYVEIFIEFAKAMKAVDPTIKVGGPSCDVYHHEDYFEPLLKRAGDQVDFLSVHCYSLRSSIGPESELFDGLENLKPVAERLDALVEQYQPHRKGEIEYSITEWNSKLPKDQDAYRLFNGLWFSSWIGEMATCGIDSATVWDMFSGDDNGHGMLVRQGDAYGPTGRYWAFWLWSHYMADTLIASKIEGSDQLHVHATRDGDSVYVMIMNESRTESFPVELDLIGFKAASDGKEITLSSREYFWNPVTRRNDWNSGPSVKPWTVSKQVAIPPYCVKVYQFDCRAETAEGLSAAAGRPLAHTSPTKNVSSMPELNILLPASGFGDLEVEGWVRAFEKGTAKPFAQDLGKVTLTATAGAMIEQIEPELSGATAKFILKPSGPGPVTVTAECGGLKTEQAIEFKPVELEACIAWDFESGKIEEPVEALLEYDVKNGALTMALPGVKLTPENNHIFAIKDYPRGVPKERIGGVVFDLSVPKGFVPADANMQVVLQSHGAYWIPCGEMVLKPGVSQTVRMEIPDKQFLKVMNQGFAVLFLLSADTTVTGSISIDNLGFLLRPQK